MSEQSAMIKEDQTSQVHSFWSIGKKISPFLMKYRGSLFLVIAILLLFVIAGRVLPVVFGYAIDHGIGQSDLKIVYICASIYLALEISRFLLGFTQNYLIQKLGNKALYDIRSDIIRHVQHLPVKFFDKNPTGRILTRVTNDIASLGELFSWGFTAILVSIVEVVSILVALLFISVPLTLITLLIAPVLLLIAFKISKRIRYYFRESKGRLSAINSYTAESLNGMKVLQAFDKTKARNEQFDKLSGEYRYYQLKTVRLFAFLWPILEGFNVLTLSMALLIGGIYKAEFGLTIGALSAFLILLKGFFKPMRAILERYTQLQNSLASADRVFALLEEPEETQVEASKDVMNLKGKIEFRHLSFRYSSQAEYALKDLNLVIQPKESIAIVGRTGSGKTTIVSLLQRFYECDEGDILIDDQSIKSFNQSQLRSRIGVVPQDNFIFRGDIASNIGLGAPHISLEDIEKAAKNAYCDSLLSSHPKGLLTPLEERGGNLSVGERQLIAFARILAFQPDILILDEATANIDSHSELLIQKATEQIIKNRTSIIIAHRLSTILKSDRILVMDQGRIVEEGHHNDLLKKNGHYAKLYHAQIKTKTSRQTEESMYS